jgi:GWxTD domain-containing protein
LKILKNIFVVLVLAIFISINSFAQKIADDNETGFYFDAISFKSDTLNKARIDCFVVVPYQYLKFLKNNSEYVNRFALTIFVYDSADIKVGEKRFDRTLREQDYFKSQGGGGDYDYLNASFDLPEGKYKVKAFLTDNMSNINYERSRNLALVNFDAYPFSLSGALLASSIEENGSSFKVSPYFSDNVADLSEGFFMLLESYNKANYDTVKFQYKILNDKGEQLIASDTVNKIVKMGKSSNYLFIKAPKSLKQGKYLLRAYAMDKAYNVIAATERTIRIKRTAAGAVLDDIAKAIEQCRYVASASELSWMKEGKDDAELFSRFEEFWSKLDPTPGTDRNEAFDEYFERIRACSSKFSVNANEGWKTDMGMAYIIYGSPIGSERSSDYRGRVYEKWTYSTGRTLVFVDNTGFGDFRLYQPFAISDKYKYE